MEPHFPVQLLVSTPKGDLPFTPERARLPLPQGPDCEGPLLTYGPYMDALSRFLGRAEFEPLRSALSKLPGQPVSLNAIRSLEIISKKHGALYHVAQVRVHLEKKSHSFALEVAVRPDQQAFLESEFQLMERLHDLFGLPFLPRPYLQGEASYSGDPADPLNKPHLLKLFMADWFDDYHEFHLSRRNEGGPPAIKVWSSKDGDWWLSAEQTHSLYRRAAAILTAYLDGQSFSEIYPWHHAAGDFVLKRQGELVDLRLITARDYRCLLPAETDLEDKWIGIFHFFFNLTLRLRLDRLDGTGELAWADPICLGAIMEGFLESWEEKTRKMPSLPSTGEVIDALRSFTPQEWAPLGEFIMLNGLVEADEVPFLQARLEEHIAALYDVLLKEVCTREPVRAKD